MKKLLSLLLAVIMVFSIAACGNNETTQETSTTGQSVSETPEAEEAKDESESTAKDSETVTITTLNGNGEEIELEVPYKPQRLAVMDLAALDILDNLGMGDRVTGVSKGSSIDYLQDYVTDDDILNLGTIKEADLEAVMECAPDLIFIGGRLASHYAALSEIAPVVYLATDVEKGVVKSTSDNAMTVASIFGAEDLVSNLMTDYDTRITALSETAKDKTAVVGMVNAGGFGVLGNDARCSVIGVEVGFENIGLEAAASSERSDSSKGEGSSGGETATHGNEASFEVLVSLNPDYIFAMDRDAAIGTEGAQLAAEVLDNELVQMTDAYQNGNIIVLEHSNVWYTAEGGITALDIMLSDLEAALL